MESKHFSHHHPLTFHHLPQPSHHHCSACKSPATGNIYVCWQCNYFLHDQCFRATRSLNHPSHPLHPLTLQPFPTYPSSSFFCNSCNLAGDAFSYTCAACEFDIHLHCALMHTPNPDPIYPPPNPNSNSHDNPIYPPPNPNSTPNSTSNPNPIYPPPNPNSQHNPIYPPPNPNPNPNPTSNPNPIYPPPCPNPHHNPIYPPPNLNPNSNPNPLYPPTNPKPNSEPNPNPNPIYPTPPTAYPTPENYLPPPNPTTANPPPPPPPTDNAVVNPAATPPPSMIKHFSHPHALKQMEIEKNKAKVCSACEIELTGAAYCCTEPYCTFNLHKSCFDSPREIKHQSHHHHLTLLTAPPYSNGSFACDACVRSGKAFSYTCSTCSYDLHIDCIRWPETVTRPDHEHALSLYYKSPLSGGKGFACSVCQEAAGEKGWVYYCRECGFGTHMECVKYEVKKNDGGGSGGASAVAEEAARFQEELYSMQLQKMNLDFQMQMAKQQADFMNSIANSWKNW